MMRIACARIVAATFWLPTALYCLLSAIPFASEQFLKPGLSPALVLFAALHRWISLVALVAAAVCLAPPLRSGHRGARAFVAVWSAMAIGLFFAPPLSRLEPSTAVFTAALLALVPPVWIAMMDLRAAPPAFTVHFNDGDDDVRRDFVVCMASAFVVTTIHAIAALPATFRFGGAVAGVEILRSLLLHLIVFASVFAAMCVIRGAAGLIWDREFAEAVLARCALAIALALFISRIVLRPLSLVGPSGTIAAAAFGAALAATFGPRATRATTSSPGLAQAFSGLVPSWATRSRFRAAAWIAAVTVAIWAIERRAAISDWNFAIAKSAALASWLLVFAVMLRVTPAGIRGPQLVPFAACFALAGLYAGASRLAAESVPAGDAWKGRDPSVRLIADAFAPAAPVADEGLEDFLQLNTNIPRSRRVEPVTIELATLDGPPATARPHIFFFVIDSLRRDYLSPYNRAVSFTPAFGAFARESVVFERAFTRYGATGLSVPAMWVGGLVLHKQYVTPFAPMNTLARLVEHEQYQQWIGIDNILDVILPPSAHRMPLDAGIQVADYRFCRTLREVRGRLDRLKAATAPAFVYSLPQDVHVSVITREGARPVDEQSYSGFYAPYASRVRRLDACFGEFIADLKTHGLFDRSIVIVTADHGDSLGEQGRMGHAYTLFPEIVQIPLMIHLPSELRARLRADTAAAAFTTDITPTLYALLGYAPAKPARFFGRSLFHGDGAASAPPDAEPQLVASSYGNVYGALLDRARRLYIVDGIGFREYEYEIDGTGPGRAVAITDADRVRAQRAIRATVKGIGELYGYRP